MGRSPFVKNTAKAIGWLALATALIFLVRRVAHNAPDLIQLVSSFSVTTSGILVSVVVVYGLALFGKGLAWGHLLAGALGRHPGWPLVVSVHGRSQIYKYLPGNVFHFASRQILGREFGWSHANIAAATTFEVFLNVAAALLVGVVLGSLVTLETGSDISFVDLAISLLLLVGLAWMLAYAIPHLPLARQYPGFSRFWSLACNPALLRASTAYLLFFSVAGILYGVVLNTLGIPLSVPLLMTACAAFSFAWIVGFVTPGAPGGLGVREALLILLLSPSVGESVATAAALLYRFVTLAAEFLYFLSASAFSRLVSPQATE